MKDRKTNLYTSKTRALAFIIIFSIIFTCFFGCKDKDEDKGKSTTPIITNTETTKVTESSSVSSSDTSGVSSNGTTSKSTGTTGKSTSTKKTTKSSGANTTAKAQTTTAAKSNTYYAPTVYSNSAPGNAVFTSRDGTAAIDYSNTSSGYIMFLYTGSYSHIKLGCTGPNGVEQFYDMFSHGSYEAIPLTAGSGTYSIRILGNNGGTSYAMVDTTSVSASLSSSTAPFVRPNLICSYSSSSSCVQYAANLTRGCDTDVAKVEAIYNYVVNNFSYDYAKASAVANAAYVPNLSSIWSSKKGICYDYAAIMTAMLRTQKIPTKVIAGYVNGNTYHAWISTYIRGSGWVDGIIYFDGNSWKLMDPTFASTGGNTCDWSKKSTYQTKYTY